MMPVSVIIRKIILYNFFFLFIIVLLSVFLEEYIASLLGVNGVLNVISISMVVLVTRIYMKIKFLKCSVCGDYIFYFGRNKLGTPRKCRACGCGFE